MNEFSAFMRGRLAEVLLLSIASAALFSTVTYGFHVEDALRTAYVAIVLLPLLLTSYFTAISFSPRSVVAGSIAFAVAFGVVSVALGAATGHAFFYDEYGNTGFFVMLGTVTTTLGYLMTRRKASCVAYAVGGCFICALVQFLYLNDLVAQALVFLVAAICLCVVCANRVGSKGIAADDVPSRYFLATGLAIAAAATLVACGAFAAVVAPLDPPAREIKVFTEYFSLETVHVRGDRAVEHKENDELVSDDGIEGNKQTDLTNGETDEVSSDQSDDNAVGSAGEESFGGLGFDITGFGDSVQAVNYLDELSRWLYLLPLVLALLLAAVLAKLALRRRRYRKMLALPARERAIAFYRFFDARMAKLGVKRNSAATPYEHANNIAAAANLLEKGADGATFLQLTEAYCACVYGAELPVEADLSCCEKLYAVFYRNARKMMGTPRYLRRFFRL